MLSKGASQPWQQTLKELTGGETMDAAAMLAYFAPLQTWLTQQNEGQTCGWQASATAAAPAPATATPGTRPAAAQPAATPADRTSPEKPATPAPAKG